MRDGGFFTQKVAQEAQGREVSTFCISSQETLKPNFHYIILEQNHYLQKMNMPRKGNVLATRTFKRSYVVTQKYE